MKSKDKLLRMFSTLKYSFIFLLIFGCANSEEQEKSDSEIEVSGMDYRPILGKDLYSAEVRDFLVGNKITYHKNYMTIRTERGSDNVSEIAFHEACPAEYLPFGTNHFLNQELAIEKYGEPDFILERTFAYEKLNLVIQFASSGKDVDDIGVVSSSSLNEAKASIK